MQWWPPWAGQAPEMLRAVLPCYCCHDHDKDQMAFPLPGDEHLGAAVLPSAAAAAGDEDGGKTQSPLSGPWDDQPADQKAVDPAQIQARVDAFAKRAVSGCPCTYLKCAEAGQPSGFSRVRTTYCFDKTLEYLLVLSGDDSDVADVTCAVSSIQDVYSLAEDSETCFPAEVLSRLRPEERDLLLMIVFRHQDRLMKFCILEESPECRDNFLECSRILCIYAQSSFALAGKSPVGLGGA